jgi:hypothetical protein
LVKIGEEEEHSWEEDEDCRGIVVIFHGRSMLAWGGVLPRHQEW